ncbi:MAG: sulfite exporter TauE/SafE family protein [Methylococcaceae bacterium]|nr:sulfite exporter TauE/SafE family protein [Methylococcaceae bacterium]MDZ4155624.1 sulfite exporter TauE/SafE family protein [Methylococcales bacterium]MDP2392240.1 sulfite exporter TauE/SafE family protein [Methylococcaceae bacterium]MDP3018242.1 sulfite exporter TauE/SafE family protein [Methylococcaceae bacterium]MDP3389885.1 sulfite exporter TauE/SafE family protein [Methylococcaceae bacterium]
MILALALSIVIGLLLGLLGGGGSILTVPMLVYVLHVEPKMAIVTSFVVVGISSLMALIPHARRSSVCWKSGMFFGLAGMLGAFGGGRLASHFPADLLMALFGLISLSTGLLMLRGSKPQTTHALATEPLRVCPLRVPYLRVLFDGFFVGALTGMVGIGGGFLIVPALTLLVGLPMQGAVGTSLLVIAMNALAGLTGYSLHVGLDLHLTVTVTCGAIVGSAIGGLLSGYVKPELLRPSFGALVVLVAGYVLYQAVTMELLITAKQWLLNPQNPGWAVASLVLLWGVLRIGSWIHKTDTAIFTAKN